MAAKIQHVQQAADILMRQVIHRIRRTRSLVPVVGQTVQATGSIVILPPKIKDTYKSSLTFLRMKSAQLREAKVPKSSGGET